MQKILVLAANPKNTSPLRLNEELREIKEGMRQAGERQQFLIESAEAVRTRDIHRSILNVKPNIIHFSGHGSGEQGLVFEDETGNAKLVDAAALARLFKLFASDVKCIVLNACYSETQAEAIAQHIDYVIGMSQAIGDKAAIEFAVGFYDALGAGRSIEFAYELGCSVIQIAGISESLTPKLLTKKQLNLQPSNQTLPSFSESDGSGQRVTFYKPPAPSDDLSSDRTRDYIKLKSVQPPQTDDLSSDRNKAIAGDGKLSFITGVEMSIRLEPNDRNDLINLLISIPELETERQRRQMLESAGFGDFTKRIDLSGDTRTVVSQMVTYLSQYGRVNEVQTALGLFLITVKNITGYEQQDFIDKLVDKYQLMLNRTISEKSVTNLKEKKSLSSQQQEKLQYALIDAFPRKSSLEQLLWFELDKNLDAIAGEGNLQDIAFNLIIKATSEGWVEDLIHAARKKNFGNPRLRDIAQELLTND